MNPRIYKEEGFRLLDRVVERAPKRIYTLFSTCMLFQEVKTKTGIRIQAYTKLSSGNTKSFRTERSTYG